MTLRDRLRARQSPTAVIPLAAVGDGEPEQITLRALAPQEWEALVDLHPPVGADVGRAGWDVITFRPALLAVSVVVPDGEDPLSAADWADLIAGQHMTAGEINLLFNTACNLNDRTAPASVGKDSGPTGS